MDFVLNLINYIFCCGIISFCSVVLVFRFTNFFDDDFNITIDNLDRC